MALLFDPDAFEDVPQRDAELIMAKIEWLWEHRTEVNHFPLTANLSPYFKRRFGDYRILYSYNKNSDELVIHIVGNRDKIYKRAKRLTQS